MEWTDQDIDALWNTDKLIDYRTVRGGIAALGFIIEKSAKYLCEPEDLEKEMLQLGMSSEHAKQLYEVYVIENKELSKVLCASFIRVPSLTVQSQETYDVEGVPVQRIDCRTSTGRSVTLVLGEQKLELLKTELNRALDVLKPYEEQRQ